MSKPTKLTAKRRKNFLAHLANGSSVTTAADLIGMSRGYLYELREANKEFAALWDSAWEEGTDRAEDEALRRAVSGVDEPVFYQGAVCGMVRKYSDGLLTTILKARRPEKYRERVSNELTGKDGAALGVVILPRKEIDGYVAPDAKAG